MSREELEQKYMALTIENEALSQEIAWYREQVKLQQKKLFGRSSEKDDNNQISLFDEAEIESTPLNDESSLTDVKPHKRKRKSKLLSLEELKHTSIDYVLSDDKKVCPKCGNDLHEMSTRLQFFNIFLDQ